MVVLPRYLQKRGNSRPELSLRVHLFAGERRAGGRGAMRTGFRSNTRGAFRPALSNREGRPEKLLTNHASETGESRRFARGSLEVSESQNCR